MKAETTIKKEIRLLRKFIDAPDSDLIAARIAWQVEQALRWVVEDVKGWPKRAEDLRVTANIIRQDLKKEGPKSRLNTTGG